VLHVSCTVLVPDVLCRLNIINTTRVGGDLTIVRSCRVDIWIHC